MERSNVVLNVYDMVDKWNDYTHRVGLGVFHSGVEVHEKEYSFGHHPYSFSGIFAVDPKTAPGCRFRQSVFIGETELSSVQVQRILEDLGNTYHGNSYHVLKRNCNHFTEEFCKKLVSRGIPGWVNRLAWFGTLVQCLLPKKLGLDGPTNETIQEDGMMLDFVPFSGSGRRLVTLPANDDSDEEVNIIETKESISKEEKRKLLAEAAERRLRGDEEEPT